MGKVCKAILLVCAAALLFACGAEKTVPKAKVPVVARLARFHSLFSPAALQESLARVRPTVEAVLGSPVPRDLKVVAVSNDDWAARRGGDDGLQTVRAFLQSDHVFGGAFAGEVDVLLDRFWEIPAGQRAGVRDLVVAGELVQAIGLRRFGGRPPSVTLEPSEAELGRRAADEGVARFVEQRVADRLGLEKCLPLLAPPAVPADPAARQLFPQFRTATELFARERGLAFFAAVAGKLGFEKAFERVYRDPPRSVSQVVHPGRYLAGVDPVGDRMTATLSALAPLLGVDPAKNRAVPQRLLRLQSAKGMEGVLDCAALYGKVPAGGLSGHRVICYVVACDSDESAIACAAARADAAAAGSGYDTAPNVTRLLLSRSVRTERIDGVPVCVVAQGLRKGAAREEDRLSCAFSVGATAIQVSCAAGEEAMPYFIRLCRLLRGVLDPASKWARRAARARDKGTDESVLLQLLFDKDPEVRRAALVSLAGRGWVEKAPRKALDRLLADPDVGVRAVLLSFLTDEALLRALSRDDRPRTRAAAVLRLSRRFKDRSFFLDALKDEDPRVRAAALRGLLPLKGAILKRVLADSSPLVRLAAVVPMASANTEERRSTPTELLQDPDPRVRRAAWCSWVKPREAVLSAALSDPDPVVREAALEKTIMTRLDEASSSPSRVALDHALLDASHDEDPVVKQAAGAILRLVSLTSPASPKLVHAALEVTERHGFFSATRPSGCPENWAHLSPQDLSLLEALVLRRRARLQATVLLGETRKKGCVRLLRELTLDPDSAVRAAALRSLRRLGVPEPDEVPQLIEILQTGCEEARDLATQALAKAGGKAALDALLHAAETDRSPSLRGDAVTAAADLAPADDRVERLLVKFVRSDSHELRSTVRFIIRRTMAKRVAPAIMDRLEKARDPAVLTDLCKILQDPYFGDTAARKAIPRLRELSGSPDPSLRRAAKRALRFLGDR